MSCIMHRRFASALDGRNQTPFRIGGVISAAPHRPLQPAMPGQELERVEGIEPSSSVWKTVALPLSYTRDELVPAEGPGGPD